MLDNHVLGPNSSVLGAEKLTSVFGKWPDFHDSEILGLSLDRGGPFLLIRIAVFEKHRDIVNDEGFYQTTNNCIVTFRFEEVRELWIENFNHQNVLAGIIFEIDDSLRVTIEGIFGLSARFLCSKAIVESVAKLQDPVQQDDTMAGPRPPQRPST